MGRFTSAVRKVGLITRLRKFIGLWLLLIFFIIMIVNAIIISVDAGDPLAGLTYLGNKFILTTENLREDSKLIVERGGIYDPNKGFFGRSWDVIKSYSSIIGDLIIIFIWIKGLMWILGLTLFPGGLMTTARFVIAAGVFIVAQMVLIATFGNPEDILSPFTAWKELWKAIQFLFSPVVEGVENFVSESNIINNSINLSNNFSL